MGERRKGAAKEKDVESLDEFVRRVMDLPQREGEVLFYRGHYSDIYELEPYVLRDEAFREREHDLLHELVASHPHEFAQDSTALEQLARAQHYGLPTRLLDVTWNPLVALYFAASKGPESGTSGAEEGGESTEVPRGEVVVLAVEEKRLKYYDSHTVGCIANLAHLDNSERKALRKLVERPKFSRFSDASRARVLKEFNKQPVVIRLLDSIREEKPYFAPKIDPRHLPSILCVKPKSSSQRILVQAGAFLIWGLIDEIKQARGIRVVRKIGVAGGSVKADLLKQLDKIAIHPDTLFPEIDKAAHYIKSKYRSEAAAKAPQSGTRSSRRRRS